MTALHCIGGRVAQAGAAMAAAWPLATRAQHHVPVIGFLSAGSAAGRDDLINGFRRGLSEAGYVEGRNVALEFASSDDTGLLRDASLRVDRTISAIGPVYPRLLRHGAVLPTIAKGPNPWRPVVNATAC
jgi:hypothetical protein